MLARQLEGLSLLILFRSAPGILVEDTFAAVTGSRITYAVPARSLGEFGPILLFAGATLFNTDVMPITVFLHMSVDDVEGAVAVSMLMIGAAVLVLVRLFGQERFVR